MNNNKYRNNSTHTNKYKYPTHDDRCSDKCCQENYKEDEYENCLICENDIIIDNSCENQNQNSCHCNLAEKKPSNPERTCCCKKSMIEALKLLCNTELSDMIDFEKFAFISNTFIVGARLVLLKIGSDEKDNLSNLDGSFKRFSACNCDLIEIGGTAAYNVPLPVSITDLTEQIIQLIKNIVDIIGDQGGILGTIVQVLNELTKLFSPGDFGEKILQAIIDFIVDYFTTLPVVDTASLCNLDAVAFQVKYVDLNSTVDETREEATEKNYRKAKAILTSKLEKTCFNNNTMPNCNNKCDCDDCCCKDSILNELFNSNLSHKATLTAGNLTLREATVLGVKGDVLVIANDKKRRFYFVCSEAVEFLE